MQFAACISQCTPPTAPVQSCNLASRPRRRRLVAAAAASGGDNTEDIQDAFKRAAAAQQALEEYRLLMQRPDDSLDLVACTSLIARHRYPLLDHAEVVEQLDDLAVQVQGRLPAAPYPLKVLQTISKHLYEDRGFRGNTTDYYSPDNSCINKVLQSRQGLPISLSLVYMEVARRVGVPMVGVNIPAHFFISPADPQLEFLVDPFGGSISFLQDAEETLARIAGTKILLDPAFITAKQPMPPRVFLARWLNNLAAVYANVQQDWASAYAISQYMLATRPGDVDVLRDSGVLLYRGKRFTECIETFREYLARAPSDSEDAERIRAVLRSLEQQD